MTNDYVLGTLSHILSHKLKYVLAHSHIFITIKLQIYLYPFLSHPRGDYCLGNEGNDNNDNDNNEMKQQIDCMPAIILSSLYTLAPLMS